MKGRFEPWRRGPRRATRTTTGDEDVTTTRTSVDTTSGRAGLVIVRDEVHLLAVRLQVSVAQDPPHRAVADLDALRANVFAKQ